MSEQMSIFDFLLPRYYINKPIRMIELFAGIGSQLKSLEVLKRYYPQIQFESYKTCEWALNSIIGYNAIHNNKYESTNNLDKEFIAKELFRLGVSIDYDKPATYQQLKRIDQKKLNLAYDSIKECHNLVNIMNVKGEDLGIVDTDKYDYILTYSFPCQDLSNAGLKKGCAISQKDGGTRSGLLWEVERLLNECQKIGNLPQILLMENVPDLVNQNFVKQFQKWRDKLESLGYSSYCEILNAKDYQMPQNRKRVFCISILGEQNYSFPKKVERIYNLEHMIEDNVDEKYFLSEEQIEDIRHWNAHEKPLETLEKTQRNNYSPTITTRTGDYTSSMILVKQNKNNRGGNSCAIILERNNEDKK